MKTRAVAGIVDHRAADPPPGVVLAQLDRVRAADDPFLGPVQLVRAGLIGDPVLVRVPERTGLQDDDLPPLAGQSLGQDRPTGSGTDHDQVHLLLGGVLTHGVFAGQVA